MAWELGFNSVILEEDAKEVFTSFEAWGQDLSHTGVIMQDAIHVASWFDYFKVCFAPRH